MFPLQKTNIRNCEKLKALQTFFRVINIFDKQQSGNVEI